MTNMPAVPKGSVLATVAKAKTDAERTKARTLAGNYVTNENFREPVPAFFLDLPFGPDNEEITDNIALNNLVSENPDQMAEGGGSVAFRDLVNKSITVWDLRAHAGGMERGWKAYLLLDITIGDSEVHEVANTGAKQIVARLARAYADGQIPCRGRVIEVQTAGGTGNKPLAFIVESDF